MRQEQALLDQRRSAILGQLTSLSALAAETAGNLPEVPEILFSDFESLSSGRSAADDTVTREPVAPSDQPSDEQGEPNEPGEPGSTAAHDEDATTVRYLDSRSA